MVPHRLPRTTIIPICPGSYTPIDVHYAPLSSFCLGSTNCCGICAWLFSQKCRFALQADSRGRWRLFSSLGHALPSQSHPPSCFLQRFSRLHLSQSIHPRAGSAMGVAWQNLIALWMPIKKAQAMAQRIAPQRLESCLKTAKLAGPLAHGRVRVV